MHRITLSLLAYQELHAKLYEAGVSFEEHESMFMLGNVRFDAPIELMWVTPKPEVERPVFKMQGIPGHGPIIEMEEVACIFGVPIFSPKLGPDGEYVYLQ